MSKHCERLYAKDQAKFGPKEFVYEHGIYAAGNLIKYNSDTFQRSTSNMFRSVRRF